MSILTYENHVSFQLYKIKSSKKRKKEWQGEWDGKKKGNKKR